MSGERTSINFKHGYIKVMDLGSRIKMYHAILWRGHNMRVSKRKFTTATAAADYGHDARRKSVLLKRLYEKENGSED